VVQSPAEPAAIIVGEAHFCWSSCFPHRSSLLSKSYLSK
jgi:hypothetical protein